MNNIIKGTYANGVVTLDEPAPVETPMKVLVTFLETEEEKTIKPRPKAGFGKGMIQYMAPDFDEPLDYLFDYLK